MGILPTILSKIFKFYVATVTQLQIIGEIEKGSSDETGKHKGLKNLWEHSLAGSNPASTTNFN